MQQTEDLQAEYTMAQSRISELDAKFSVIKNELERVAQALRDTNEEKMELAEKLADMDLQLRD